KRSVARNATRLPTIGRVSGSHASQLLGPLESVNDKSLSSRYVCMSRTTQDEIRHLDTSGSPCSLSTRKRLGGPINESAGDWRCRFLGSTRSPQVPRRRLGGDDVRQPRRGCRRRDRKST